MYFITKYYVRKFYNFEISNFKIQGVESGNLFMLKTCSTAERHPSPPILKMTIKTLILPFILNIMQEKHIPKFIILCANT